MTNGKLEGATRVTSEISKLCRFLDRPRSVFHKVMDRNWLGTSVTRGRLSLALVKTPQGGRVQTQLSEFFWR